MKLSTEVRKSLEVLMIEHTFYASALSNLYVRVEDTLDGMLPCFEMLIGPSRCGKTEILRAIARSYPETSSQGRRQVPVLIVYVTSGTTPKDLPTAVIQALGIPVPRGSIRAAELNNLMIRQLQLAGVRVILFDEASHLVDIGTRIPARAASDWFKDLVANLKDVGIVLSGLPRLKRLLESNEQLRNRARKPIPLMPYRWDNAEQRKSFAGCVIAFLEIFKKHGCKLEMPVNHFVRHCYAASAGHIGLLANFYLVLAEHIDNSILISLEICALASAKLNLPGSGAIQPFLTETLEDMDLLQILVSELDRYNLILEKDSAEIEIAEVKARVSRRVQK